MRMSLCSALTGAHSFQTCAATEKCLFSPHRSFPGLPLTTCRARCQNTFVRVGSILTLLLLFSLGSSLFGGTIVGVYSGGEWSFRTTQSAGPPNIGPFPFGASGWTPITGDWNGSGQSGIGVVDPGTATWYLRNTISTGAPDITPFTFGAPNWTPLTGDWTGSGRSGIGSVSLATETWYLRSNPSAGAPDITPFTFGAPNWTPVSGDWTGSGHTGIGVFDPSTATWYLRNSASSGTPEFAPFTFGAPGWEPITGDWTGSGHTGIGVFDPTTATWYLRESLSAGTPDFVFQFGGPGGIAVTAEISAGAVPEPATFAALIAGFAALFLRSRVIHPRR